MLVALTFLAQRRRSRSANRAQQVVLAAAVFDKDGRLMVSPEGLLPNRKITNTFIERVGKLYGFEVIALTVGSLLMMSSASLIQCFFGSLEQHTIGAVSPI